MDAEERNPMKLVASAIVFGILFAAGLLAPGASAAIRPFFSGGGEALRTRTETLDENLDPITIRHGETSYNYGAGLRFFPSRTVTEDIPLWEIRLRYERGAGDLAGSSYGKVHDGRDPYNWVAHESYSQSSWTVGGSFLIRPIQALPRAGVFIEPALQFTTLKGSLLRTGEMPHSYFIPITAEEKKSTHYGLLEVGASWSPRRWWPGVEAFWIPARFQLSTVRRASPSGWEGTFAAMRNSFGARVVYSF
jgi:hypothetical protein